MNTRCCCFAIGIVSSALPLSPAQADVTYAQSVLSIRRGDPNVGNFPGFYGGALNEDAPVELTDAQARASVLGSPDGRFLSLPGRNDTPPGQGFRYAYVDVAFDEDLTANGHLRIFEIGQNSETAHLWIWARNGGNIQPNVQRGADQMLIVDLRPLAAYFAENGGPSNHVTIGGTNLGGPSAGFDLDAIAFSPDIPPCIGDLNGDRSVDMLDLTALLVDFGTESTGEPPLGDLDSNGRTDVSDLAILLSHFGMFCP